MNVRQKEIKTLSKIINDMENSNVASFNDWKWFKTFDNLEEATGFLLGHLKRTRELLKYGLTVNKKLLEKLEDKSINHKLKKECYYGNETKRKTNS